jgi:hypothetical protein
MYDTYDLQMMHASSALHFFYLKFIPMQCLGARGSLVVKAQGYKLKGRGFETR